MRVPTARILATLAGIASVMAVPLHPPQDRLATGEAYQEALSCLALNVYWEARSESPEGQNAVAAVTLNRVESQAFPDSVCGVVKQGGERRNRCQFSWWCDGKSDRPDDATAWHRARTVAGKALAQGVNDPTDGALYYHATYVSPRWAGDFEPTVRIGSHLFYRKPGVDKPERLADTTDPVDPIYLTALMGSH